MIFRRYDLDTNNSESVQVSTKIYSFINTRARKYRYKWAQRYANFVKDIRIFSTEIDDHRKNNEFIILKRYIV